MFTIVNNLPPSILNCNSFEIDSSSLTPVVEVKRGNFDVQNNQGTIINNTIAFSGNIEIVDLIINGAFYRLVNNPTPNPGEFFIDYSNQEIVVNVEENISTAIYTTVIAEIGQKNIIDGVLSLFEQYIVVEDFTLNQTFNGHPSGSFQIRCSSSEYASIRNELKPGTPVNILNIDYRIRKLTRGETLDGFGNIVVNVDLQGYWEKQGNTYRSPLDEPIKVKDFIRGDDCKGFQYTYRQALREVGIRLGGGDLVVKFGRNITENATITARQILEDQQRLLVEGYYVDWSSRTLQLRQWERPKVHYIDSLVNDLSKEGQRPVITISENGFGEEVDGCYLTHELNGAELRLEVDPSGEQDGDERVCLQQGNLNATEPPLELRGAALFQFDRSQLRSSSLCFDNGELVSTLITRCQLNGSDIELTEESYGFVYTSADTYEFRVVDANGTIVFIFIAAQAESVPWQLVKQIKYEYIYNPTTGYYEERVGGGWELTRDLREEGQEAIELVAAIALEQALPNPSQEAIANLQKQLDGYTQFYRRSIVGGEQHDLEDLSLYYDDLVKPDEVSQDEFIPALYAKEKITEENGVLVRPDPRSTRFSPQPDLILGEKSKQSQQVTINSIGPEKFLTRSQVTNQEDENLQNAASNQNFTENFGRPSLQNRLVEKTGCNFSKRDRPTKEPKYLVSTPGRSPFDQPPLTLSYPGAYTLSQARNAATIDYKIKNTQTACTTQLPLGNNVPQLQMGDVVVFQGSRWRVFSNSISGQIQPSQPIFNSVNINIGKEINFGLSLRRI